MPELGAEAGEQLGLDLSRLVLWPEPGPRWLAVTATIAEVMQIVAVRPPTRASDADVSRLSARLRDRGAVLLVQGPWPQAEAMLSLSDPEWTGLGHGHGRLDGRVLTVTVSSRRWPVPRSARLRLPDVDGGLAPAPVVERSGSTLPVVERAAGSTLPVVERAADSTLPVVERAADETKRTATAFLPVVERAADETKRTATALLPVVERASAASETKRTAPTDPLPYLEAVG
jgi:hypothetical protein